MRARERNSLVLLVVLAGSVMWAWVDFAIHGSSDGQLIVMVAATVLLFLFVLLTQHALRRDMRDVQRKVDVAVAELVIASNNLAQEHPRKPSDESRLTIATRREAARPRHIGR